MEKLTYTSAKKELEAIVLSIESGELDVDLLTDKVKRASELIAFCKEKLTKTEKELQKILDDIV
ncbi:MAG: exodeoxyribonuclease VII small subunit [Proteiniphilum sp.]|jgi:exodeoxyribonuclease VII small subunit